MVIRRGKAGEWRLFLPGEESSALRLWRGANQLLIWQEREEGGGGIRLPQRDLPLLTRALRASLVSTQPSWVYYPIDDPGGRDRVMVGWLGDQLTLLGTGIYNLDLGEDGRALAASAPEPLWSALLRELKQIEEEDEYLRSLRGR